MLTPEDKARIAAEEEYRAQVRAKIASKPKRGSDAAVAIIASIGSVLLIGGAFLFSGPRSQPPSVTEGQIVSVRGAAGSAGTSTAARLPYFDIEGSNARARCYYTSGRPPTPGEIVTVMGTVTASQGAWVSIRPCAISAR